MSEKKKWKILGSRPIFNDKYFTVRADRVETPTGNIIDPYYVQEAEDWAIIVAFDSQKRMLVIEQYRHAAGEFILEIPGGCVDPGESPETAAKRELLEETGCVSSHWSSLFSLYSNPTRINNQVHAFLVLDVEVERAQRLEQNEEIRFSFLSIPEVLKLLEAGGFGQSMHVGAIALALRRLGV